MDDLEEIKRKKLEQYQEQLQKQTEETDQIQAKILQLETAVKSLFTKEALQRYGNLKAAYPEKAIQVLAVIGKVLQSEKLNNITDEQLKELLKTINQDKEITIKRK